MSNQDIPLTPGFKTQTLAQVALTQVIIPVAYRLVELPSSLKLHNVFHKSLLKPARDRPGSTSIPPPPPQLVEGEWEFEVESIYTELQILRNNKTELLVKWQGCYGPEHTT